MISAFDPCLWDHTFKLPRRQCRYVSSLSLPPMYEPRHEAGTYMTQSLSCSGECEQTSQTDPDVQCQSRKHSSCLWNLYTSGMLNIVVESLFVYYMHVMHEFHTQHAADANILYSAKFSRIVLRIWRFRWNNFTNSLHMNAAHIIQWNLP